MPNERVQGCLSDAPKLDWVKKTLKYGVASLGLAMNQRHLALLSGSLCGIAVGAARVPAYQVESDAVLG